MVTAPGSMKSLKIYLEKIYAMGSCKTFMFPLLKTKLSKKASSIFRKRCQAWNIHLKRILNESYIIIIYIYKIGLYNTTYLYLNLDSMHC